MVDHNNKTVNNMTADDAVQVKNRIIHVMNERKYYGPVQCDELNMYRDRTDIVEDVNDSYSHAVFEREANFTDSEMPEEVDIKNGYSSSISDKVRIKEEQGAKIINPLLGICDKGDFTFVVANDLIPNSFDKNDIGEFLTILEKENEDPYENESSCRSACTGLCVGTCGNTCDGCFSSCENVCTGCGACTGQCSHMCGESCVDTCKSGCTGNCGGQCTGCHGSCLHGCFLVCYAACGGGCTSGCSHTCKGGVGH